MRLLPVLIALLVVGFAANPTPQFRAEVEMKDGVPMYINYQGYLTDLDGNPITSPGLAMSFSIYDAESGGSLLWGPQLKTVPVRKGVFNVKLLMNEGDTAVFRTGARRWFQLVIAGQPMTPRTEITSMAYGIHSAKADNADMLDNKHHTDFIWNSTTLQAPANFYISGSGITNGLFAAYGFGLGNHTPTIYGRSEKESSFAVYGINTNTRGTGVAGCGNYDTIFYLAAGSGGTFSGRRFGLFAYAHDTNGTGVATMGNRIRDTVYSLAVGCGGAFNGTTVGVYGLARNLSGNRAGGYFRTFGTSDSTFAYVAYHYNGQNYKILGDGSVSTVMATREGRRILFAPEAPQPFFEDFGEGRLVNGHCRVDLDPLFLDCVALDESNSLRVFVTLTDDCNGVYVKPDRSGFDVYELKGGRSSAGFYWRVIAPRKDGKDLRFPVAPPPASEVGVPVRMQPSAPGR